MSQNILFQQSHSYHLKVCIESLVEGSIKNREDLTSYCKTLLNLGTILYNTVYLQLVLVKEIFTAISLSKTTLHKRVWH